MKWIKETTMNNWKILAEDKAKELHIKVNKGTVIINVSHIPKYMSVEEFLDYIQKKNIVISNEEIEVLPRKSNIL